MFMSNIVEAFSVRGPLAIAVYVLVVLSWWFIFEKAGKPAWWSLVPILNYVAFIDIARKPWWYVLLMFVPILNFFIYVDVMMSFSKAFGQDGCLFALGLTFIPPLFLLILAFGDAEYQYGYDDYKAKRKNDYAESV